MRKFGLFLMFLLSLAALIAGAGLLYSELSKGFERAYLNIWVIITAALALIYFLVTNPLTSGLFGLKRKVAPSLLAQGVLVLAGAGAFYLAVEKFQEIADLRTAEQQARQYDSALSDCRAAARNDRNSIAGSRGRVNCRGGMIRIRSEKSAYTDEELAFLELWAQLAELNDSGGAEISEAIELLQGCEDGDMPSCYETAKSVTFGRTYKKDRLLADTLHKIGCDNKYPASCRMLGHKYNRRNADYNDPERAADLYEFACLGGDLIGCQALGNIYESKNKGRPQDLAKAKELYEVICEGGDSIGCMFGAPRVYGAPTNMPEFETLEERFAFFEKTCAEGNYVGCFYQGTYLNKGLGTDRNVVHAAELFEQGCSNDIFHGCHLLGLLYNFGHGVDRNQSKAASLYQKSCEGGISASCLYLAIRYAYGEGVSRDAEKARTLAEQACSDGFEAACGYAAPEVN